MTEIEREARNRLAADFGVSRETLSRLDRLVAIMDDWRVRMNLIGPREFDRVWSRHILDSLQLLPHMPAVQTCLDLGSGGGFPGLILAASAPPPFSITLVESVGKKCAFLQAVVSELDLPARVIQSRIEAIDAFPVDVVTARAVAPLPKLLEYAAPWLENGALGLFHKGKTWHEELDAANRHWQLRHTPCPSLTDPAAVILKVSEVSRHG